MKSFEHDYLLDMPISHQLLSSVRMVGEYRGRQTLYSEQSPEVLDTLKRAAIIQSTESSNRIEGIIAEHGRIEKLILDKVKPQDRIFFLIGMERSANIPKKKAGNGSLRIMRLLKCVPTEKPSYGSKRFLRLLRRST